MEIEAGAGGDIERGGSTGMIRGGGGGNGYMVWEELRVIKPVSKGGEPKMVLNGLNGFAEPFRIMAVMGPSGSGKSTFLDALSGRLSKNVVMTGNIFLQGKKSRLDYGVVAYITQEDVLLGTLTVRETITYSANLRLPTTLTKQEMEDIVDGTIMEMGLEDCADRVVGNWHRRGISGGEKRRLSIALEILTRPQILFLDEPTSGLDSASAFFVVQALRSIAGDGRIVISSIHQPSSEVFALFDDLYLLSGGETVFFGEANLAVKFFAEAGFPCPSRRNPSDHFLRSVNSDFDAVLVTLKGARKTSDSMLDTPVVEIKRLLIEKYKQSTYGKKARARVKEINDNYEGMGKEEVNYGNQTGWLKQLRTLTKRSFVNMTRDIGYYWLRLAIYIAVSICVGSLYFNIGNGYTSIMARGACSGFMSGFMIFMSIGGFPNFIEEMKVFYRERLNGHYGVGVFIVSNFVASFPFLAAISSTVAILTYFMVRYHRGIFPHLIYHVLSLFGCISAIESCMMVIASLVPNFMMGVVTGAGIIGIMMLTSGFYRFLADLPKVFWRYPISYVNFLSWAFQGAIKELLVGEEFEPLVPGSPMLQGEDVVKNMFKIPMDHSQWWDLAAILISVLFYRLIFFVILKFKETASPFLQSIYSKRALKNLDNKKTNNKSSHSPLVGTSKRHNTPLPLSSQEGLNSPMHF